MIHDDKYIVFKRSDWERELGFTVMAVLDEDLKVSDAVVIRRQDIFAGPALHAYASSISTAIEIIDANGVVLGGNQRTRLDEIRDYFFQQALDADDVRTKKVPD